MNEPLQTERDQSNRCASSNEEKPGRTHWCRRTKGNHTQHNCICTRTWESPTPKPGGTQ